jgi:hypothetical protein
VDSKIFAGTLLLTTNLRPFMPFFYKNDIFYKKKNRFDRRSSGLETDAIPLRHASVDILTMSTLEN